MSLFEDPRYIWRETYFVVFPRSQRPDHRAARRLLDRLARDYEVTQERLDAQGRIESFTLKDPSGSSAMDVCYVTGSDVTEQLEEFARDLTSAPISETDAQRLKTLQSCDARFEVFHFERRDLSDSAEDDEEEWLDPAALFDVLRILRQACHGLAIDPQSGTFVG